MRKRRCKQRAGTQQLAVHVLEYPAFYPRIVLHRRLVYSLKAQCIVAMRIHVARAGGIAKLAPRVICVEVIRKVLRQLPNVDGRHRCRAFYRLVREERLHINASQQVLEKGDLLQNLLEHVFVRLPYRVTPSPQHREGRPRVAVPAQGPRKRSDGPPWPQALAQV